MHYVIKSPLGDWNKAFHGVSATLTALGFQIAERQATRVRFVGPGMTSTKQNPLLGASTIELTTAGNELTLAADLGGVEWLSKFVRIFPWALGLGIFLIMVVTFALVDPSALGLVIAIAGGVVSVHGLVWLVVGPLVIHSVRHRACRALDHLLGNAAAMSEEDEA